MPLALFVSVINSAMGMIVEDGTGLPNANSYVAVDTASAYADDRGIDGWGDVDNPEALLIMATDYIDANYVFMSVPLNDEQSLANPRYNQGTALKPALVKATIELALMFMDNPPTRTVNGQIVVIQEQQLDNVGYKKTQYDKMPADPYPFITKILKPIAKSRIGSLATTVMLTK